MHSFLCAFDCGRDVSSPCPLGPVVMGWLSPGSVGDEGGGCLRGPHSGRKSSFGEGVFLDEQSLHPFLRIKERSKRDFEELVHLARVSLGGEPQGQVTGTWTPETEVDRKDEVEGPLTHWPGWSCTTGVSKRGMDVFVPARG